jgi:hypothetical protein
MNYAIEPDNMKKLTRNQKIAIGVGVAAVGGLIIYIIANKPDDSDTTSLKNAPSNTDYLEKIKALQKLLGVGVDGIVGPKTKAALKAFGLPETITASNIDSVIAQATTKASTAAKDAARYNLGKSIFTAFSQKKGTTIRPKENIKLNQWATDALGQLVITKKDTGVLTAGGSFKLSKMLLMKNGFLLVKLADREQIWVGSISPYSISLF